MEMNNTSAWTNVTTNGEEEVDCYPSLWFGQVFLILDVLIILIGLPSNAFSLFVSCKHIRQKNEMGIYLFSLSLSDLLFIMSLPVWMDYIYNDQWRYGRTMCAVCVFVIFTNFNTSAMLLCCIAVDRYLAVVHPLSFLSLRKSGAATAVSGSVWVFTLIFNSVMIKPQEIYDETNNVCLDVFPLSVTQKRVFIARFFLGFLLLAVVVVFCYWKIGKEVRSNQATGRPERRRVFMLMGSVLLSLCLCFGPIHVMMLLRAALEKCKESDWLFTAYKISGVFSHLNCLADPLLYCFITKTGQASVSQALLRLKRKSKGAASPVSKDFDGIFTVQKAEKRRNLLPVVSNVEDTEIQSVTFVTTP